MEKKKILLDLQLAAAKACMREAMHEFPYALKTARRDDYHIRCRRTIVNIMKQRRALRMEEKFKKAKNQVTLRVRLIKNLNSSILVFGSTQDPAVAERARKKILATGAILFKMPNHG